MLPVPIHQSSGKLTRAYIREYYVSSGIPSNIPQLHVRRVNEFGSYGRTEWHWPNQTHNWSYICRLYMSILLEIEKVTNVKEFCSKHVLWLEQLQPSFRLLSPQPIGANDVFRENSRYYISSLGWEAFHATPRIREEGDKTEGDFPLHSLSAFSVCNSHLPPEPIA